MDLGDRLEDSIIDFHFTTVATDGSLATLSGTPALSVYKANSATQSTAGITLTADFDTTTGLNHVRIDTSADAFYATGNDYSVVITTGSVSGTSVVGYVVGTFSIENRFTRADVLQINSDANAAARLALSAAQMIPATVDNAAFTPTSTEFECDDITEATTDHYKGRLVVFTTGNLAGQVSDITAYTLTGGRGHFTVTALTEAPGNNDTLLII